MRRENISRSPGDSHVVRRSVHDSLDLDVEILARYISQLRSPALASERIYEFPLNSWEDVGGSKVKGIDFFIAFRDILRIYSKYMRHLQNE